MGWGEEVAARSWQRGSPGKGWQPPFPWSTPSPVPTGCPWGGFRPHSIIPSKAGTSTLWAGVGGPKWLFPRVVG